MEITGEHGLRCAVAYGAAARLGLTAQRKEAAALRTWRQVTEALLDSLQ